MDPKRKRKRTPEERAADQARHEDIMRRLQEMIERYRTINAEKRRRRQAEAS
jgi:competence protein ComGF